MVARHWHKLSEPFTGADSLVTALDEGWVMNKLLRQDAYRRSGGLVIAYFFELEREGEIVEMAVISNPYVCRLMAQSFAQTILTPS